MRAHDWKRIHPKAIVRTTDVVPDETRNRAAQSRREFGRRCLHRFYRCRRCGEHKSTILSLNVDGTIRPHHEMRQSPTVDEDCDAAVCNQVLGI